MCLALQFLACSAGVALLGTGRKGALAASADVALPGTARQGAFVLRPVMNRWLLEEGTAADSPLDARSRQGRRSRSCGKASCAGGCVMLATAIVVTSCAVYSLMISIATTARSQEMLVVECNITHGEVVEEHAATCSGSGLQRALAPWMRRLHAPAKRRLCYAPQW